MKKIIDFQYGGREDCAFFGEITYDDGSKIFGCASLPNTTIPRLNSATGEYRLTLIPLERRLCFECRVEDECHVRKKLAAEGYYDRDALRNMSTLLDLEEVSNTDG